jgi:hypothetical protein
MTGRRTEGFIAPEPILSPDLLPRMRGPYEIYQPVTSGVPLGLQTPRPTLGASTSTKIPCHFTSVTIARVAFSPSTSLLPPIAGHAGHCHDGLKWERVSSVALFWEGYWVADDSERAARAMWA